MLSGPATYDFWSSDAPGQAVVAAADGGYDPAQGSPGGGHPTGEDYPDEAVRYDDPDSRPRSDGA